MPDDDIENSIIKLLEILNARKDARKERKLLKRLEKEVAELKQ